MKAFHPHWRFPNLTLLALSFLVTYLLLRSGTLHNTIEHFGSLGYFGVFVAGMLFTSTFTIAPAAAILFVFAQELSPYLMALVGGAGGMIGDYIAMRFIRERLLEEINPFLKALHIYRPINLLHSKYFIWLAPVVGAAIVASPFPDEAGLVLLGASKVPTVRLLLITFVLDSLGVFLITLAVR